MTPDPSYRSLFTKTQDRGRLLKERVLLIGAGGIGCELLKNLVLTGFQDIHVADLDTIDLSNLNRQFLFGFEDVKKSKAKVAKETAERFNHKAVQITSHHANIKEPQFDVAYFASFAVVFNALDNVDARRYVNRMVIAADVPMVDCGTTGYQGHTSIVKKGRYPCYDCTPKETPKSFPVCTIRSTPSQPIHCIVWAKSYLFTEIFGVSEEEVPELDFSEDSENADEIAKLRDEAAALKKIRASMREPEFSRLVFDKVFVDDVERLRAMEEMWKSRTPPTPLDFDKLSAARQDSKQGASLDGDLISQAKQQQPWSIEESFAVFVSSLRRLVNRHTNEVMSFDKDDEDIMDFVAAAASLRSHIFCIEARSKFSMKQMAGNIIPAIATTNAMFAALATLEGYKILQATHGLLPWPMAGPIFSQSSVERVIETQRIAEPPNPYCAVCSVAWQRLAIDLSKATVQDLIDLLEEKFQYEPSEGLTVENANGLVFFDPDLQDNGSRLLQDFDLAANSIITVRDESEDNARVNLLLAVSEKNAKEGASLEITDEIKAIPLRPALPPPTGPEPAPKVVSSILKRKRSAEESIDEVAHKKRVNKPETGETDGVDDVVVVNDTGAIEIEDD